MKTFAIVLASAYLVLGGASAQGSSCSGDIKVSTQDDLNRLKSCSTYQGNIVIDNVSVPTLELKGVQMLKGDLLVSNNNALTSFSTGNLQAIDGTLKLSNNKILSKLDISQLTALRSFEATVEPALSAISFTSGLSQVDRVQISDTTATAINGLKMQKLTDLLVDNNIYLKSLPISNLTDISGTLTISANSPDLNMDVSYIKICCILYLTIFSFFFFLSLLFGTVVKPAKHKGCLLPQLARRRTGQTRKGRWRSFVCIQHVFRIGTRQYQRDWWYFDHYKESQPGETRFAQA